MKFNFNDIFSYNNPIKQIFMYFYTINILQTMNFELISEYKPTGDQPEAIKQLTEGLNNGTKAQTLLGVTG